MSKVIYINRRKAAAYRYYLNDQLSFDRSTFVLGLLLTVIFPTAVYCSFRGPVPFAVFAGVGLIGFILGLVNYALFPHRVTSIFGPKEAKRSRQFIDAKPRPERPGSGRKAA
jgi:hypothetical protein